MSTPPPPPPTPPPGDLPPMPPSSEGLQFEQAEFDPGAGGAPATQCASCKQPITGEYYEANGNVMCPSCKESLHAAFTGGSRAGRLSGAFMLGVPAALLSAVLYYYTQKITGYNLAIATIAMGWFVGIAVRRGARFRGGPAYQALAVVLTYLAISLAYVPLFAQEILKQSEASRELATGGEGTAGDVTNQGASQSERASEGQEDDTSAAERSGPHERAVAIEDSDLGDRSPGMALLFGMALIFFGGPILVGMESPIALLIYGFGLFQAWQLNRRPILSVTGPYNLHSRPVHDSPSAPPPPPV